MVRKKTNKLLILVLIVFMSEYISAQSCSSNYLSVSGNQLHNANGDVVRLTGINWFGFETANRAAHGLWARDAKSMLIQIKDLGFNSVRIPWSNAILEPDAVFTGVSDAPVPDPYTGRILNVEESKLTHPLDLLDLIMSYCEELNLKVILDNHSREPDGYLTEALWYTELVSHEQWVADWVFLADRYKDLDAVVAMDINNEPHGNKGQGAQWGTGNIVNDWRLAAEACGNAILEVNPNVLIMVEGVEEFESETYWWGGNLKGVTNYPIRLSDPSKLMYSPHEYGPTVFQQEWFSDPSFPNNMPAIWEENFNYILTQNISPLFAGEFGIRTQGGPDEIWFDAFLDFMGQNGYSWTFWCWNPNSGDTGGILTDDWTSINQWKMDKLIPHLAPEIPNTIGCGEETTTYTITSSASIGGSISPSGMVEVDENSNQTYTITPNTGYIIADVVVNGSSVGAVSSYVFSDVTTNQTISASFTVVGNNTSCSFGTPLSTALSSGNYSYNNIHVVGTGGPDLSNVTMFTINWDLQNNGLWQMSMNTNNGMPTWWSDLRASMTYNFNSTQPDLTMSGTGFPGLDGSYYVNFEGANFVMVSKIGDYAIYFSNTDITPECTDASSRSIQQIDNPMSPAIEIYPNPFNYATNIKIQNHSDIQDIVIMSQTGQKIQEVDIDRISSDGSINIISDLSPGVYILQVSGGNWSKQIKMLKR